MRFLKWAVSALLILVAAFWASSWFTMRDSSPHAYAPVTEEEKAEAEAYIAAGLPPMPQGWSWETFEPEPGIELRVGSAKTSAPQSKGTILLVPGYTAMLELYSETFQTFIDDGYDIAGIEYRGQGFFAPRIAQSRKGPRQKL